MIQCQEQLQTKTVHDQLERHQQEVHYLQKLQHKLSQSIEKQSKLGKNEPKEDEGDYDYLPPLVALPGAPDAHPAGPINTPNANVEDEQDEGGDDDMPPLIKITDILHGQLSQHAGLLLDTPDHTTTAGAPDELDTSLLMKMKDLDVD